jgi:hypothetical protein
MMLAARRAEYDYFQKGRAPGSRFIGTPDPVIRAMLTAALATVDVKPSPPALAPAARAAAATVETPGKKTAIVTARNPRRSRPPK